jgi:hypothetical protein
MTVKASGRSALILTAGLLVLIASPVQAATDGDDSTTGATSDSTPAPVAHRAFRRASHHRKSYAHRKLRTIAKADADKGAVASDATPDDNKAFDNKTLPDIPSSIANANAQMLLAGTRISAAAAIPAGTDIAATESDHSANASADNGTFVVAADQLNDVDRTLQEGNPTATATASPPPAPATTMTSESSVWDQTTLIGKIFIGFGALLTMASAARMFIT